MLSQGFYISTSQFILLEGEDKLARISSHREEVRETIAHKTDTIRIVTVVTEYTALLKVQVGTASTTYVRVTG